MSTGRLPIGTFIRIKKPELQSLIDKLLRRGYQVVGPIESEAAIVFDEISSVEQLPQGKVDEQDGGKYRLRESKDAGYFDYVVGPHSLKNYLFPPQQTVVRGIRRDGSWEIESADPPEQPIAVIGARGCDLSALAIQDRVFLKDQFVDPYYKARREGLFVVAINCRRAAATCFCHSMNTGPDAKSGFDLALTEMADHFVVEVGTEVGGEIALAAHWSPCTMDEISASQAVPKQLKQEMDAREKQAEDPSSSDGPRPRYLETKDLNSLLMSNLEHPQWDRAAERCLACANCTMVCPTCFCSTVDEVACLTGESFERERRWDSCFVDTHSYIFGGSVRNSTRARYRQWLTHKLATWEDQFGTSGCVGCGRCITWCPVAIDLTEEVAAIRGEST